MPNSVRDMIVKDCKAAEFKDCDVVFSGLDAEVAGEIGMFGLSPSHPRLLPIKEIPNSMYPQATDLPCLTEMEFIKNDLVVFSNSKNYRRDPITPLIVPLVNTSHFSIIPHQRSQHGLKKGFLVTNANCSTTGLVVPLKALEDAFGGIELVTVTTLQAISGGGYPGVPSMDILDNIVPLIGGEEEKIEWETGKILGSVNSASSGFDMLSTIKVSAQCNRVAVMDGHTACVSLRFTKRPPPSIEQIKVALRDYVSEPQQLGCPSAPKNAIVVMEEEDRPQPRLDRNTDGGYAVSVGRIRPDNVFDIKFVTLSHNTVIGAAGSSILNAEAAVVKGLI